jgi:hypothetical protein
MLAAAGKFSAAGKSATKKGLYRSKDMQTTNIRSLPYVLENFPGSQTLHKTAAVDPASPISSKQLVNHL